ncbi:hypothetical protein IH879_21435 [candidate division KSB1 bacterium]|nr:hypothetical protein [candidate division KSB1 bacterium]MCH8019215.1 hypothetical protein [candidate division KSB1 bacterium]
MKKTKYFDFRRQQPDRKDIKIEWIQRVLDSPLQTEIQTDGRKKLWGRIEEVDKYLRVVVLEDGETVHNAFFDRSFKGEKK